MNRLRCYSLLFSWVAGFGLGLMSAAPGTYPNIVFIMTDEHRWDCIGANGNTIIRTPNLDRLAAASANFTHAFVSSPVCVPSRISFFTGRYAHSHRNRVNYTPLDNSEVLMQARLKEAGYATASVGKLHLFPPTVEEAQRTGFDFVELHDAVGPLDKFSSYVKWLRQKDAGRATSYRAVAKPIEPGGNPFRAAIADEHSETSWTGQRARHHLEQLTGGTMDFVFEKGKGIKGTRHPDAKMVRTRRWKFNYYPDGYAELYDMERDPGEARNLHGDPAHAAVEAEMKDRLLKWLCTADEADQIAPRWLQVEAAK